MIDAPKAIDYEISPADAGVLRGAALLPHDVRVLILEKLAEAKGPAAMIDLFSRFIGLANSVVANNREAIEERMVIAGVVHPDQADKINLPTIAGALGGVLLAAGVDPAKVCGGCAFRVGTWANQSPSTGYDAEACLEGDEDHFMCHEGLDEQGDPTRKCAGFAQARKKAAGATTR